MLSEDGTYLTTEDADLQDDLGQIIIDFDEVYSEDLASELAEEALNELN